MGLDVYVGSLTRYFARDWKTVVEQAAEQGGPPVQMVRAHEPDDAVTNPEQIRPAVIAWRRGLSEALGSHLRSPLDWDESAGSPYFTDKPAWDCYGALILWAAYAEHPDLARPAANPLGLPDRRTGDWHSDPAYRRTTAEKFRTSYAQLVSDAEVWLPADYEFTFEAQWLTGTPTRFGACRRLLSELDALNARTWTASEAEMERWPSRCAR